MPAETVHDGPQESRKAPRDERDELASLEAKERKIQEEISNLRFDKNQKEAFGKFDVAVPNEGEDTYQSYLDKRPAAGIIRNGDVLRNAEDGTFASADNYEVQRGDTWDYYNDQADKKETTSFSVANYENLGVMQLAKAAATARQEGNAARESVIKEALEHHLTMDAMRDDSESPEAAQARYDSEVARYEQLVDRFSQRGNGEARHATDSHTPGDGEGEPSQRVTPSPEADEAEQPGETQPAEQQPEETEAPTASESPAEAPSEPETAEAAELAVGSEAFLNGQKVSISEVFPSSDGSRKAIEVTDADGKKQLVYADDLGTSEEAPTQPVPTESKQESQPAQSSEEEQKEPGGYYNGKKVSVARVLSTSEGDSSKDMLVVLDDDGNEYTIQASQLTYGKGAAAQQENAPQHPGKELELYQAEKKQLVPLEPKEEAKKWWHKVRDGYYKVAGAAFWAQEWARQGWNKWLDYGTEGLEGDEKEERRKDNRYVAIAAGVGLGVIGAVLASKGLWTPSGHTATSIGLGEHNGWTQHHGLGHGAGGGAGAAHETVNLPLNGGDHVTSTIENAQFAPIVVQHGEGGIQLFNSIGLKTDTWNSVAAQLPSRFPADFEWHGTDVWISHSGALSQPAQDYINGLR